MVGYGAGALYNKNAIYSMVGLKGRSVII